MYKYKKIGWNSKGIEIRSFSDKCEKKKKEEKKWTNKKNERLIV